MKAGDHFFDLLTGDAYNPADPALIDAQFTITAPDGTIYKVHAANGITEQQFTDGKKFILSDSGITAVGTGESIQFVWNSALSTAERSGKRSPRLLHCRRHERHRTHRQRWLLRQLHAEDRLLMLQKFPGLFCVDELSTEGSEVIVFGRYRSE